MYGCDPLEVENKPCDVGTENRSMLTLPDGLEICKSKIPGAGMGVKAKKFFRIGTRFGPYDGSKVVPGELKDPKVDTSYMWEIMLGKKVIHYINGKDMRYGNWLRYINCSRIEEEQNLVAFQYKSQIYHRAYKDINIGDELLVWYGNEYAKELGIIDECDGFDDENMDIDLRGTIGPVFECNLCHNYFTDKKRLLNHMKICITHQIKTLHTRQQSKSQLARLQLCRKRPSLTATNGINSKPLSMKQQPRFKCNDCGKCFTTDLTLDSHNCTLPQTSSSMKCHVCGLKFEQSSHLEFHLTVHQDFERRYQETKNRCFKCYMCDRSFPTMAHLKMHQVLHDMSIQCQKCIQHFKTKEMLDQHQCIRQQLDSKHPCHKCELKFESFVELQQHLKTHIVPKDFKTNSKTEVFICYLCGHHAFSKPEMRYHFRMHLKRFECHVCGQYFTKSSELEKHSVIHSATQFTCRKCGKVLDSEPAFLIHLDIHADEEAFKFECSVCGKRFHVLSNLESHLKVHAAEKTYKCDVLGQGLNQTYRVKEHTKLVHSKPRQYKCTVCGQKFDQASRVKEHVASVHSKPRQYKCSVCEQGFDQASKVKEHVKSVHSKPRHYHECNVCGEKFNTRSRLDRHLKAHKSCSVCKLKVHSEQFVSHMKTHTTDFKVIVEPL